MQQIIRNIFIKGVTVIFGTISIVIILGYSYTLYKEYVHPFTIPPSLKSIVVDGETMTYLTYGDPTHQPIILLHGTGANAFIWEKNSQFLAEQGYYVIALDIPPFGWTSIPKNQDYRKEAQAARIIKLMTQLTIVSPIIVGHSFNSKIALQIASSYPSKKLIFIAPVLDYEIKKDKGVGFIGNLFSVSLLRDPLLSLFVNNTLLAQKILLSFMYKKDADISSQLAMTVLPFNKKGVNHAYGEWFQEFFDETSLVRDDLTLQTIKIPVRVLWGDKDTIAPISNWAKLQLLSKDATVTTLEGVGHMPHLEGRDLFNTNLLQVLEK